MGSVHHGENSILFPNAWAHHPQLTLEMPYFISSIARRRSMEKCMTCMPAHSGRSFLHQPPGNSSSPVCQAKAAARGEAYLRAVILVRAMIQSITLYATLSGGVLWTYKILGKIHARRVRHAASPTSTHLVVRVGVCG